MAYMRDAAGSRLDDLDPVRDLPNVLGNWDASVLPGEVGETVDALPDLSGWAQDLLAYSTGTKPMTIAINGGQKVVRTNGEANYFSRSAWGQRWGAQAVTAPVTVIAVAAASATFDGTAGFPRTIWSSAQWDLSGTLASAASAGATSVSASINPGAGEYVRVESEVMQVAAVSGSSAPYTLTLTSALASGHASGAAISTMPGKVQLDGVGFAPAINAPLPTSSIPPAGPPLNDGSLHVHVTVVEAQQVRHLVDGAIVTATSPSTPSLLALRDLWFGGMGMKGLHGDLAQLIVCQGALSPAQIQAASAALCAKWGIATAGQRSDLAAWRLGSYFDTTSSNGQSIRIFPAPPSTRRVGGNPLVIWSHPHAANQNLSLPYFSGPMLSALNNAGFHVAASYMHGNNWGNQNGLDDNYDLYNRIVQYFGTPSDVIMVGASMGGLASLLAVPDGQIPNVRGAYLIDGVCNLSAMYGSGSNTYSSAIATAYGLANSGEYAAKTAGHDPRALAASTWAGKRLRFLASTSDTDVPKASNADSFASYVAAQAVEYDVITHVGGHLATYSSWVEDALTFAQRCIA